jgi:DNA-binding PadR family transcriptional regulator
MVEEEEMATRNKNIIQMQEEGVECLRRIVEEEDLRCAHLQQIQHEEDTIKGVEVEDIQMEEDHNHKWDGEEGLLLWSGIHLQILEVSKIVLNR